MVESGGNFKDYIRFLFCHLFGPVNHGQNLKGWERSGEKIISISDTCKNQPKRLDFDDSINLSTLIVSLGNGGT
jgi:hypothetical protein